MLVYQRVSQDEAVDFLWDWSSAVPWRDSQYGHVMITSAPRKILQIWVLQNGTR